MTPRHTILLIDDDRELAQMLIEYLADDPLDLTVCRDGPPALAHLESHAADLILLDVGLPTLDGFSLLTRLREHPECPPIIMLTAQNTDQDRVRGLELGADDYVAKPFNPRELRARILAVLRRSPLRAPGEAKLLRAGPLKLAPMAQRAWHGDIQLTLTPAELRILEQLMRQPGAVVERATLSEYALRRPLQHYDRSIDTHVNNLRRKLRSYGDAVEIRNLRGVGYALALFSSSALALLDL